MTGIAKCWICRGPILAKQCIHCGRSYTPDTVSLGEALLDSAAPIYERAEDTGIAWGERQKVPVDVSLARAEAWMRGERAE